MMSQNTSNKLLSRWWFQILDIRCGGEKKTLFREMILNLTSMYDASHLSSAWFDHRQDDLPQGRAVANYLLYQVNQLLLLTSGLKF